MAETLDTLIGIQEQIIHCRRLASQVSKPEEAARLFRLADELEARAREVDLQP